MSKIANDQLNPVWHRMLYSCTRMIIVGVKGLKKKYNIWTIHATRTENRATN